MDARDGLRSQDVRDADELIGQCRELGGEPSLWRRHMFRGLARLLGVLLVAGGEALVAAAGQPIEPVSVYGESDDSNALDILAAYHRKDGPAGDPILRALAARRAPGLALPRRALVPDAIWYRSASFEEFRRPAGIDHTAMSIVPVSARAISGISLHGVLGEREITQRELNVLAYVHAGLGRLIGGPLVGDTELGPEQLSPRLLQTLGCLLQGDSEQQVAARLGLSRATVHQYVTTLYRRFRVHSCAQLFAHMTKRLPREPWRAFHTEVARGQLAGDAEADPGPLSPRLRQTLGRLLEGDSEKQVAAHLDLSSATVHQYVTTLYRHFGVSRRAQLLAHVLHGRAVAGPDAGRGASGGNGRQA